MHPTSRIFFIFGFAKFGVRWAAKYSSSGTGWTRVRSAVCMDVYETGHCVLHGCLNACLAFIFALAQNFWHNSIYQRPQHSLHWSMKKGQSGPSLFSWRHAAGNSNEYCLSKIIKYLPEPGICLIRYFIKIHFTTVAYITKYLSRLVLSRKKCVHTCMA